MKKIKWQKLKVKRVWRISKDFLLLAVIIKLTYLLLLGLTYKALELEIVEARKVIFTYGYPDKHMAPLAFTHNLKVAQYRFLSRFPGHRLFKPKEYQKMWSINQEKGLKYGDYICN